MPSPKNNLTHIAQYYYWSMSGTHDSSKDFELKAATPKYPTSSSGDIGINFGDKVYILPENFLLYIDDLDAIGFSWLPPKHFLDRLNRGYQNIEEDAEPEKIYIGYLTKIDGQIVDVYRPYSNEVKPVHISDKIEMDESALKLLRAIYKITLREKANQKEKAASLTRPEQQRR